MGVQTVGRELTGTYLESRFHVNPESGEVFYKKDTLKGGAQMVPSGYIKPGDRAAGGGYRMVSIPMPSGGYKKIRAQHLVWVWVTGRWPDEEIDHKNTDRDDNRFENLREATVEQNRRNSTIKKNNKSGYKWVRWCTQRKLWCAEVIAPRSMGLGRRRLHSSYHKTALEAHNAACDAAKTVHREFYNPGGSISLG